MQKSDQNNAYKWNHHYLLLLLSRLTGGEIENVVRYKTLKELSNLSGFTEKTVSTLLKDLGPVDLCCTYFTQQYIGSHIIENASDTILA